MGSVANKEVRSVWFPYRLVDQGVEPVLLLMTEYYIMSLDMIKYLRTAEVVTPGIMRLYCEDETIFRMAIAEAYLAGGR